MEKTGTKNQNRTQTLVVMALMAAVTGVLSWVSIPLPFTPIPVNLALAGVLLAGNTLGSMGNHKAGAGSMLIYIALGAVGLPVFHSGSSGIGILFGPTGGFIAGYIVTALISGYYGYRVQNKLIIGTLCNFVAILACYAFGLIWFIATTGSTIMAGLTACVFPFIIGDLFKSFVVALISCRVNRAVV